MDGTIFVTGASGFIGSNLIGQLLADGNRVRGMSRTKPRFPPGFSGDKAALWDHPNFEYAPGDILDRESLTKAMAGCDYVIHLAGYAKNYSRDRSIYERVNKGGMENIFDAAEANHVKKIVWTSSIVTLGATKKGEIGDESTPRQTDKCLTDYERSKLLAEKTALRRAAEGVPAVIVLPTRVYGPGQLSEGNAMAALINDYRRGRFPILLNRGVNIGNYGLVDDVARGHYLALQKGRVGQRYILGGENVSLKELFALIDRIDGKKRFQLPIYWFWPLVVAQTLKTGADLFGYYPRITPGWVRTYLFDAAFSTQKAQDELGYRPTPLIEGLARTCRWLDEQNKKQKSGQKQ